MGADIRRNMELVVPWLEGASRRKRWLVGVSGGMDSMGLLKVLEEAGFADLVVCHLDHGLRGKESAGDARFVKRVGEKMGHKVEMGRVKVRMEMGGESLETAARRARHVFFAECARKQRCKRLLLAHHADDQAETVLWNLMRGSFGCRGMRERQALKMDGVGMEVWRPLLGVRKLDLKKWMAERGCEWREDGSNGVNDVVRNRVRNEVLPLMNEVARRDVAPMLAAAAEVDEGWRGLVDWAVGQAQVLDPQGRLHVGVVRALPGVLQRGVVVDFLRRHEVGGMSGALVDRCVELLDRHKGASVNLPGGRFLRRRAGRIIVEEA